MSFVGNFLADQNSSYDDEFAEEGTTEELADSTSPFCNLPDN